MKTYRSFLLVGTTLLLTYCSNTSISEKSYPGEDFINQDWAMNPLWDDGQAEVATYAAERVVYDKPRQFEYTYVLVKEVFNKEYQVKTDSYDRDDLYDVMKVNKFCMIPTLAYPYHYLTSIFTKRNTPGMVHKLTNTSQEWCGNTAKSFREKGGNYLFEYISYWDGQGNGSSKISKDPWFEDQLSYTLRTLKFEDGLQFAIDLYPMQISSYAKIPEAEKATVSVTKGNLSELDDYGKSQVDAVWKVFIEREKGADLTFWFGNEYPNYLVKMEATDGRKLSLKKLARDAYWEHE